MKKNETIKLVLIVILVIAICVPVQAVKNSRNAAVKTAFADENDTLGRSIANAIRFNKTVKLVNEEREKEGLSPVKADETLMKLAEIRAEELANSFSHLRPDGSSYISLFKANEIVVKESAENFIRGTETPEEAMAAWMDSQGHKEAILNSELGKIGIGYYESPSGECYWVQLFTN